jgi:hypothetical protein
MAEQSPDGLDNDTMFKQYLKELETYPEKDDPFGDSGLKIKLVPVNAPRIAVGGAFDHWEPALTAIFDGLAENALAPSDSLCYPWIRPAPSIHSQRLLDTALASRVWSLCNPEFARHAIESYLAYQVMDDQGGDQLHGWIPNVVTVRGLGLGLTGTPLLEWATWELFKKNGSLGMLQEHFSHLFAFHLWLDYNRDLQKTGLYSWIQPAESGFENAPRFDETPSGMLSAVDFSSCVSIQLRSLINMATVLKEDTIRESLETRKAELDEWINTDLWDASRSFYFDRVNSGDDKDELIGPLAASGFYPLFAGIVPQDRLPKYLKHLTNADEFWTAFPVSHVSKSDPHYNSHQSSRGATYVPINYMIIKGLKGYGFRQVPGELAFQTISRVFDVYKKKQEFYEFYDSAAKKEDLSEDEAEGKASGIVLPRPQYIGWTGLVANIYLEDMLGIEQQYDSILLDPSVPDRFIGRLNGGTVSGVLPGVPGWDQDRIQFKMEFKSGDTIEYEFVLDKPMDVYVVEFKTKEKIFSGEIVRVVNVEVKNNKDVISIFSKPDESSIDESFIDEDEDE